MLTNHRTTSQAAARLGVTPRWISTLVQRDELKPALKLPGKTGPYLFDDDELDRYERAREGAAYAEGAA